MNITPAGIGIALALVVVAVIFIFPNLSPFGSASLSTASSGALNVGGAAASTPEPASVKLPTVDTLQSVDVQPGTGAAIKAGDTIAIKYVGALTDGTVFDSTDAHGGTPLTLIVGTDGSLHTSDGGSLITGWSQGVAGMKMGGVRRLAIPANLAYGDRGITDPSTGKAIIPPGATLLFEIQLVSVTPAK